MADLATGVKNKSEIIRELNLKSISSRAEALTFLKKLKEVGGDLLADSALKESVETVIGEEFEIYTIDSVINALEKNNSEFKDDDFKDTKALRKDEIEELISDYDKYLKKEKLNEEQALKKTIEENKNISQKSVEQLIKRQQELYKKNLEKLESQKKQNVIVKDNVIDLKETKKVKDQIKVEAEIITKEEIVLESRIEKKLEISEKFEEISQKASEIIINNIVKPEYGSINEEVEKLVEAYIKPENKSDFKEEFKEIIEVAKIEIEVENRIEESTNKLTEELKTEEKLKDKIERNEIEINNEIKEVLREKIRTEEIIPDNLSNKIIEAISKNEPILGEKELTIIKIDATKSVIETNNWIKAKNEAVNIYRGNVLTEKIEAVISSENLNLSKEEINQVKEYQKLVKEIYYPKNDINIDQFKSESFEAALKSRVDPGKVNNEAWNDVKGVVRLAKMTPEQFKDFSEKYKLANNVLKGKLPYGVKECGSLDRIMSVFDKNPALKKLLNASQKLTDIYEKLGGFVPNLKMKLGLQVGGFITERIGNQAIKVFAQNTMIVIAKNGLENGMGIILKGLVTKGAVTAGATAGGASAAIATAGAAVPGIGWIVAGASLLLSPILNKIKDGLENIFGEKLGGLLSGGLNLMGSMKVPALLGKLSGFLGLGGGAATAGAGTAAAAGAATAGGVAAGAGATAVATPVAVIVIVCVIVGMFVYSIFQSSMISSMVPPKGLENEIAEDLEFESGDTVVVDINGIKNYATTDQYIKRVNGNGYNIIFSNPFPLLIKSKTVKRSDIVALATSIIGVPYYYSGGHRQGEPVDGIDPKWGIKTGSDKYIGGIGRTLYGLDCSGFVAWVYYQATGVNINNTATGMYTNSTHIDENYLQPGDIGVVNTNGGMGGNHVGIYLGVYEGKKYFIHAGPRRGNVPDQPGSVQISAYPFKYFGRISSGGINVVN